MRPRRVRLAAGIILVASALAGCSTTSGDVDGGDATTEEPKNGGTLVFTTDEEPSCLDIFQTGGMAQNWVARQFLDNLVYQDEDGEVQPWLATGWEVSDDGLLYTFDLRDDVTFTDGTPFDAAAVKRNLEYALEPETNSFTIASYIGAVFSSADVIDDNTVQITLSSPYSPFLHVLTQTFFGIQSPAAIDKGTDQNCKTPVGTGPFIVESWTQGEKISLVRNEDYDWAPGDVDPDHEGPAYLDGIEWRFAADASARYNSVASGESDIIYNLSPENQAAATAAPNLEVLSGVRPGFPRGLVLNVQKEPFDDIEVRKAFLLGADIDSALSSVFFGVYERSSAILNPGTIFADGSLADRWAFDPDEAGRILDEAGWTERDADGYRVKDGERLAVDISYISGDASTPPSFVALYEQIQASEKEVGFDVTLIPVAQGDWRGLTSDPQGRATTPWYWMSNTPDLLRTIFSTSALESGVGTNPGWISNPELDELLEEALATTDAAEQERLYTEAQQLISDQAYVLGFYSEPWQYVVGESAAGLKVDNSLNTPIFYDVWLRD